MRDKTLRKTRDERNRISHSEYDDLEFSEQKEIVVSFVKEDVRILKKLYVHIAKYILHSSTVRNVVSEKNKQYMATIISPNKGNEGIQNAIKP